MSIVGNHDIEQAIYSLFTGADRRFAKVDLGSFPDVIKPGLNVAVSSGTFARESMAEFRQDVNIVLLVAVKNLRLEIERRKLAHPLIEYVIQTLVGSELNLDIEMIEPTGWSEQTSKDHFTAGESVFEVRFSTAYRISAAPPSTAQEHALTEILNEYRLHQENPPTVSDTIPIGAAP